MKRTLLILLLLTQFALAKDRQWQDAIFLGMQSGQTGAMAMPVGAAIIAAPIRNQYFWFRLRDMDYCAWFPPRLSGRIPLLTVNGQTKIAIDGRHLRVLDDEGKDWKLKIVQKAIRSSRPAAP
jgi:hypothetical protein